jgi:hypothetical protein
MKQLTPESLVGLLLSIVPSSQVALDAYTPALPQMAHDLGDPARWAGVAGRHERRLCARAASAS